MGWEVWYHGWFSRVFACFSVCLFVFSLYLKQYILYIKWIFLGLFAIVYIPVVTVVMFDSVGYTSRLQHWNIVGLFFLQIHEFNTRGWWCKPQNPQKCCGCGTLSINMSSPNF